ncbi:cytochrome P450 [Antrihabitans cavernicola]|uniref:Cytochrome P450 n=1 Tax=Antrihabitans cavernicola TaxID=2495913 RepID=A0A5A7S6E9_9NOCA|nr:cytochrome P450 [Spelaeibacter cavernicola]KAA0019419.1 cytochrome P450 [Spelaeibacter cavernicola]
MAVTTIRPAGTPPRAPRLSVVHAIAASLNPDRYFRWRRARDGDTFLVRFPGFTPVLFTSNPDGARDVFRAPVDILEPPRPNPIGPLVGDASMILISGERHRRDRALMMPPFHGERMRAYGRLIRDSAVQEMSTWKAGDRIDARAASRAITLRVILEAVFGVDSHARRDEYTRTVADFLGSYTGALMLAPVLRRSLLGHGPWDRFVRLRAEFDALLAEDVAHRRSEVDSDRTDILSMLLASRYEDGSAIDDADLREQLRSLLVAGHETTATSVTWALFHLLRAPDVLERVLDEIESLGPDPAPELIAKLPYLDAVCHETLRLHPAVPIILRKLTEPLTVDGFAAPAGGIVGIVLPLLHSHRDVWTDPTAFDPDRFVGARFTPFEYAPFGGGHRRCVGFALAEYEMRIVVATILSRARLALPARALRRPAPISVPHNIATSPRRSIIFEVDDMKTANEFLPH